MPRGWRAHRVQGGELVRSVDKALAVSVSFDRTAPARTEDLRSYASRTAHALQGYRNLHVGPAHRVPGERHPTATVQARGVFLRPTCARTSSWWRCAVRSGGRSPCSRSAAREPARSATRPS